MAIVLQFGALAFASEGHGSCGFLFKNKKNILWGVVWFGDIFACESLVKLGATTAMEPSHAQAGGMFFPWPRRLRSYAKESPLGGGKMNTELFQAIDDLCCTTIVFIYSIV